MDTSFPTYVPTHVLPLSGQSLTEHLLNRCLLALDAASLELAWTFAAVGFVVGALSTLALARLIGRPIRLPRLPTHAPIGAVAPLLVVALVAGAAFADRRELRPILGFLAQTAGTAADPFLWLGTAATAVMIAPLGAALLGCVGVAVAYEGLLTVAFREGHDFGRTLPHLVAASLAIGLICHQVAAWWRRRRDAERRPQ